MAEANTSPTGKGSYKYLCGTPVDNCGGSIGKLSAGLAKGRAQKVHNSSEQAFNCHARYLVSEGFEKLSSREFRNPDGSGIRVLTKKSRFGAKLRSGKAGSNLPNRPRTGGTCISK